MSGLEPKFLYSTNTELAYKINKDYYGDTHYVWCTPKFGSSEKYDSLPDNPYSASPYSRYKQLKEEVGSGDLHGSLIKENKMGLRTGAQKKFDDNIVTVVQRDEILYIIEKSESSDYKPLLYIIAYEKVKHLVERADITDRAGLFAKEYLIEELPGDAFDVLDLTGL